MSLLILIALVVIVWLLWNICRNTSDALDKQTAIQYEIVALEKRLEEIVESKMGETGAKKTEVSVAKATGTGQQDNEVININEATKNRILGLPGVGKVMAQRIVDGRPYSSTQDLLGLEGMKPELYDKIKARITV